MTETEQALWAQLLDDAVYPFYDGHVQARWRRASGDCVCETCGREFWRHPYLDEVDHRLCDGTVVHL